MGKTADIVLGAIIAAFALFSSWQSQALVRGNEPKGLTKDEKIELAKKSPEAIFMPQLKDTERKADSFYFPPEAYCRVNTVFAIKLMERKQSCAIKLVECAPMGAQGTRAPLKR